MNQVQDALESLERMSTKHDFDNVARFGITANKAFGVSFGNIGRDALRELTRPAR